MAAAASDEERWIELETKLLFQERTLEELNEVAVAQARELDELRARLAVVEAQLRGAPEAAAEEEEAEDAGVEDADDGAR